MFLARWWQRLRRLIRRSDLDNLEREREEAFVQALVELGRWEGEGGALDPQEAA